MTTVLVYGDSNSHGTKPLHQLGHAARFAPNHRWPAVMADKLGPEVRVIDEGLPGRTTVHDDPIEGGARNGLAVLPAVLLSHAPLDLLVLMLGTNDLKSRFSITAWEIARAVERLVLTARTDLPALDVLIVAPAPVQEIGTLRDVFVGAEARQVGLSAHLARVATTQGCGFVDAGAHIEVSVVDGVHWDAPAHLAFGAVMAGQVAARLKAGT
ncbi:SGNH/GDSL hydrolase family protein [Primorskyibacter marinus]|uniref:SGNH/GDSL hydrolase family protein n=1 Tax=Primorskyibacter marinus TaxID=1977320 RepID=UPI000E30B1B2|nr:SGNH/GDSL hydrolase family protein [Primorskyibacter marinus]